MWPAKTHLTVAVYLTYSFYVCLQAIATIQYDTTLALALSGVCVRACVRACVRVCVCFGGM